MNATMQSSPSARTGRRISIGVAPNHTTVVSQRSAQYTRRCNVAAAIIAPQGNAISVLLRTMMARRTNAMAR